jgi:hypothetical protein
LPGLDGQGVELTTYCHLAPRLLERIGVIFTPLNVLAARWGWTVLLYFIVLHITIELTPWKGLFVETLVVSYLVKKFTMFYGNRSFIIEFTKALF